MLQDVRRAQKQFGETEESRSVLEVQHVTIQEGVETSVE